MKNLKLSKLIYILLIKAALFLGLSNLSASECGLSCCLAGAAEGIGSGGKGVHLGVQYEYMKMGSIHQGSSEIGIANALATGGTGFRVPTEMIMERMTTNLAYGLNDKVSLLASIPYIKNDMDMRMNMANGSTRNMSMDTVKGLGDVSIMGFYKLHADSPVAPKERITAGLGLKLPTGEYEERTAAGALTHMMMQAGTGSWDPIFLINGMKAFGDTYILGTGIYQLTTENDRGYEVGDKLNLDLTVKHRVTPLFNGTLALNYVHSSKDSTDGSIDSNTGNVNYQNSLSLIDNVSNTGLTSYFVTPGVEFKPKAGSKWSFGARVRIPLHQDVNGIQQVTDEWIILNASCSF